MITLGIEAKDKITGFTGIITSKHTYLTGCDQYGIQPPIDRDGKIPDVRFFDEGRIEKIGEGINQESVLTDKNGCDYREHP